MNFTIDPTWTLFLDRDGVINRLLPGDYVKTIGEFEFLPGSKEAVVQLSLLFNRVIIVTNQQGIGKGYYTHDDLLAIHDHMTEEIEKAGGKVDAVFYAPQLHEENSPMRKPGIGMALQAKKIFPEIDFSRSVMIGDSPTDMEFGKRAGMKTVFVGKKENAGTAVDAAIDSLGEFLQLLSRHK
jgi:histidinol-phosphate phosphatase family protein